MQSPMTRNDKENQFRGPANGEKSVHSSAKPRIVGQGNFGNCSNFKIANECEDYYKMADEEKDYR